jgi:hypothetical protein
MTAKSKICWEEIQFEKDIPIPERPRKTSSGVIKLEQVEPGVSFTVPKKLHANLNNAIARFRKTHKNRQFTTRIVDDLVRCWRVK